MIEGHVVCDRSILGCVRRPVLVLEPSDLMMFQRDYERFLSAESYHSLASHTHDVFEFLLNGPFQDLSSLPPGNDAPLTLHTHCQQRTLNLHTPTITILTELGYNVTTTDVECCGMAGSFGYKSSYYDLSKAIGASLVESLPESRTVVATGTSCAEQLNHLLDTTVTHPIQLIAPPDPDS
jgi:Fe-S oxidoreductase